MLVNQIAVFLENRKGRLYAMLGALSDAGVNVESLNIADTKDFGIVRIITDDNEKAVKALEALLGREAVQISALRQADQKEPLGIEMLKEAGQRQAGAVDVHRAQGYVFILRGGAQHLQLEFLDDLSQFHAVLALWHGTPLFPAVPPVSSAGQRVFYLGLV